VVVASRIELVQLYTRQKVVENHVQNKNTPSLKSEIATSTLAVVV
jgi:hypothetical protein